MTTELAKLRTPTEQELTRIRELWLSCGPSRIHDTLGVERELKHFMNDSLRFIGIVAGLHPVSGEPVMPDSFPLRITEDGVKRLHNRVRLCSAIMTLWTSAE